MHVHTLHEMAKLRIDDLHREAAGARLAGTAGRRRRGRRKARQLSEVVDARRPEYRPA